jgi:diguanylate cyclase
VTAAEVRAKCEAWASRVLVGPSRADAPGGAAAAPERVDWPVLRRFFGSHRRHEADFVARSFGDLRQSLSSLVQCLAGTVQEERRGDAEIGEAMTRFGEAIAANDTAALRRASASLVRDVQGVLERRRDRQRERLARLAEKLRSVQSELSESRREETLDPVTKLRSREAFEARLAAAADMALLVGPQPSLFVVRVDQTAAIRAQAGPAVFDEVLKRVADCVQRSFLRRDDFVARAGPDDLAVIVSDCPPHVAVAMAERARAAVADASFEATRAPCPVTISAGFARHSGDEDATRWMRRAQRALADAAQKGSRAVSADVLESTPAGASQRARLMSRRDAPAVQREPKVVPDRTTG